MTNFNLEQTIADYECPDMFKAGLIYYINNSDKKIKSEKDFLKVVDEFKNLKIGE